MAPPNPHGKLQVQACRLKNRLPVSRSVDLRVMAACWLHYWSRLLEAKPSPRALWTFAPTLAPCALFSAYTRWKNVSSP